MGPVVTTSPAQGRRRTDGDGCAVSWTARRAIAEEAYRLFVESGRDVSAAPSCWHTAETRHSRAGQSASDVTRRGASRTGPIHRARGAGREFWGTSPSSA